MESKPCNVKVCGAWMHRSCAGVSAQQFCVLSASDEPFICLTCFQQAFQEDLRKFRDAVRVEMSALHLEIAWLRG